MTAIRQPVLNRPRPRPKVAPLRFVTFLAPNLFEFYAFIAEHLGRRLECPTTISVASSYEDLATADVAFVCGLPYVEMMLRGKDWVEPIAAPILQGRRYAGKPVYFSDVIVRRAGPLRSFADLRGCSWAFNEPLSQSGYGITRFTLASRGETNGYFGKVAEAGFHERALRMVCAGKVDASAIDSHVLAILFRDEPALASQVRIIDSLGPSTIQPVVAARRLPARVKSDLRRLLLGLADEPVARKHLERSLVERFTRVRDADYDDIRTMRSIAAARGFLTLR